MKLVHKMTGSLLVSACAVWGVYGYFTVDRERAMLEETVVEDAQLIARTMRVSVVKVWKTEGREAALRLLEEASEAEKELRFHLINLAEERSGESLRSGRLEPRELDRLAAGHDVVQFAFPNPEKLHIYLPLSIAGEPTMALLLEESLAREERYLTRTKERIVWATLALIGVSGVIAFVTGSRIVGQPMRRLMEKAERVGQGDLEGPLELRQSDEIGQLAESMNRMCEDLAAETERRVEAMDQLRHAERLATVGQLASGIAHELGTPLNVVLGRAMMIQTNNAKPETSAENAKIIVEQTERMSGIIRQLLDFARRGTTLPVRADVRTLVRRLSTLLEPLANEAHVHVAVDPAPEPLFAKIDTTQIEQALTNLIVNAIQATPEGGTVRLSSKRVNARPPTEGSHESAHLRITVSDEGAGISASARLHVFEPFFTTKEVGQGTGLGLPVAHSIVTDHQGWIGIESEEGQGSSFSVYLPCEEGTA